MEHGKRLVGEALRQKELPAWHALPSDARHASGSGHSSAAAAPVAATARNGGFSGFGLGSSSLSSSSSSGDGGGGEAVSYDAVVVELTALTQAPRLSGSLRSATDAALRRLQVNSSLTTYNHRHNFLNARL